MNINGEFLFGSFEEALEFMSYPTNYEQKRNIKVIEKKIMLNSSDFKVVRTKTSDGRTGITFFFKNSKKYDIWKFWMPSENQQKLLPHAIKILTDIDEYNEEAQKNDI